MQPRLLTALESGATLIAASAPLAARLGADYEAAQAAQGRAVWPTPEIFSWPAWLARAWAQMLTSAPAPLPLLLTADQTQLLWEDAIAATPEADGLLELGATARAAAAAWELAHTWRLDFAHAAWTQSEDSETFRAWAGAVTQRCQLQGWLLPAQLPERLIAALGAGAWHCAGPIWLAGFERTTPQQREVWGALAAAGVEVGAAPPAGPPTEAVHCLSFANPQAEWQAAAEWAAGLIASGAATGPIGIVAVDLAGQRGLAERALMAALHPERAPWQSEDRAFHLDQGTSLADVPVVAAALLGLELAAHPHHLDFTVVARFLRCPFLADAPGEADFRPGLDLDLRKQQRPWLGLPRLAALAQPSSPQLAATLAAFERECAALPARQSFAGWAATARRLLATLGWPGTRPLATAAMQAARVWDELLIELVRLDQVTPAPLELNAAWHRLRVAARQRQFQPAEAAANLAAPVQVLGWGAATGQRFRHLWVLGLHDGALPAAARPAPFLPLVLQRESELPHATPSLEHAHAELRLDALRCAAPEVWLSHAVQNGAAAAAAGPSPLLAPWLAQDLAPPPVPLPPAQPEPTYEMLADHQAPAYVPGRPLPSAVFKDQSACAFRAFARHRLHATAVPAVDAALPATDRGNLLHEMLRRVWSTLSNSDELAALTVPERQALLDTCARATVAAAAILEGRPGLARLEARRLAATAAVWLEIEAQRPPFVIAQLEAQRHIHWGGLDLSLRVDREDELADGRTVLLDYKSGDAKPGEWACPRPESPQLPLYLVTGPAPEAVAAVAFVQLKPGANKLRGMTGDAASVPNLDVVDLPAVSAVWEAELLRLAADFRTGHAEVAPKSRVRSCAYCDVMPLCRIGDACGAPPDADDEDAEDATDAPASRHAGREPDPDA